MRPNHLLLAGSLTVALAGGAVAQDDRQTDKIYLTDGTVLKDVGVTTEGLAEVEYREGRSRSTVASDRVLRVEYGRKPKAVDQADTFAEQDGFLDAIADMENYLGSVADKPDRRFPWAAAYARYRLIELNGLIGEVEALAAAADDLVQNNPDSRYAPLAFLAKAQALSDLGDQAGAAATVEAFGRFVENKGLRGRWPVELKLWQALTSGESGKALETRLRGVSADAAAHPTVRNRAEMVIGESLVARKEYEDAERIFRSVVSDPKADARTLAGAWTGLGDCLYAKAGAANGEREAMLREALKAYLRPVVLYPNEFGYVAKAGFYAGRCYGEFDDPEARDRSKRLYRFVIRSFPGTRWEREARNFYR